MSILIKGMERPKSCGVCGFKDGCEFSVPLTECPFDCPLVEVPDDGVVISENEFQYYSRAMLVALTLRDLLIGLNSFAEVPKSIEPVANAPTGNEAED